MLVETGSSLPNASAAPDLAPAPTPIPLDPATQPAKAERSNDLGTATRSTPPKPTSPLKPLLKSRFLAPSSGRAAVRPTARGAKQNESNRSDRRRDTGASQLPAELIRARTPLLSDPTTHGVVASVHAPARPSLWRPSVYAFTWQVCVWGGLVLLAWGAFAVAESVRDGNLLFPQALIVITAMAVVADLRPLVLGGRFDHQGVPITYAFVFASLYLWGLPTALLVQALAVCAGEIAKRKPPWRLFFNIGQYSISVAAAAVPMWLADIHPSLSMPLSVGGNDLFWVVMSWLVFFFVNTALVAGLSADEGITFWESFTDDFWFYVLTTVASAALAPFLTLTVMASAGWLLVPLVLIPLAAVHRTAALVRESEHASVHDPLTQLPNRAFLKQRLLAETEVSQRTGVPFGLAILDLDRFKQVNDTLGHGAGDHLLVVLAERIRDAVRPGDLVARLGGDEFALLLPHIVDVADLDRLADRVRAAVSRPVELSGLPTQTDASIGFAVYPSDGATVEDLMRHADVAMYDAKESGRGYARYEAHLDSNTAERLTRLPQLRRALETDCIRVDVQPQINVRTGEVVGVEALARWIRSDGTILLPDQFVPLAEDSGLINKLTARVVDQALNHAAAWRSQGLHLQVSVNISARDLFGSELVEMVAECLLKYRVPGGVLRLELTEHTLMSDPERARKNLEGLEKLGCHLSLDDFGTGWSSLVLLQQLPVGEVKVDRRFVDRMLQGADARAIVRSVVDLAHSLGKHATAEGVENCQTWTALAELGCDRAQGYWISPPIAPGALPAWVAAYRASSHPARSGHPNLAWRQPGCPTG